MPIASRKNTYNSRSHEHEMREYFRKFLIRGELSTLANFTSSNIFNNFHYKTVTVDGQKLKINVLTPYNDENSDGISTVLLFCEIQKSSDFFTISKLKKKYEISANIQECSVHEDKVLDIVYYGFCKDFNPVI